MSQRKTSTAKELRVFLVHLLCILTLVQGPPLEAAEQKVRERTLWVGETDAGHQEESLAEKAAETWQEVKEELAEGAAVLKAQWVQTSAETPKLGNAAPTQAQQSGRGSSP